ncbi:MAG: hypothetical protein WCG93_14915 [Paludibacter sp.]
MKQGIKETVLKMSYLENMNPQVASFDDIGSDMFEKFMAIINDPIYPERLEFYTQCNEYFIIANSSEAITLSNRDVNYLWTMKHCKANIVGALKKLERLLLQFITLLFGLCSSQSSLIFRSFFGPSLFRTPAL